MTIPQIPDPLTTYTFMRACSLLDIPVELALRDPTLTLRIVGSVPVEIGQAFINAVCIEGHRPDLSELREDESALLVASVWVRLCDRIRKNKRSIQRTATEEHEDPR